jgi:outer membrane protein assembly factor BamA
LNKYHFLLFLLSLNPGVALAQSPGKYTLYIAEPGPAGIDEEKMIRLFQSSVKDDRDIDQFMHKFYEKGFLLAGYHTEKTDSGSVRVILNPGQAFLWANLEQGNLPDDIFIKTGLRKEIFEGRIFNFSRITRLFRTVVQYAENHGYPFASVKLSKIRIDGNRIAAEVYYNPGPFIRFNNVSFSSGINLNTSFLEAFLNIRPGMTYDQRKIENIPHRLKELQFIRLKDRPQISFRRDSSAVFLDLEPVRANTFDGIIGFLPNENEPDKLLVTGQLYLGLNNLFRSGKKLNLEWQKPNLLMQELRIQYGHPALFRSPLDLGLDFFLFKQDTSFINREFLTDLFLNPVGAFTIGLSYNFISSRLLSTAFYTDEQFLNQVDYDLNYFGIRFRLNTLNRNFFPERGSLINGMIQLGNKKIIKNAGIDAGRYQDLEEKTFQVKAWLKAEKYFTLFPKNILLAAVSAGYLENDQLFLNDLFRLGGLKSIRGFNERFFYASWYITGTLEYRYLFENESQVFLFVDGAGLGYDIQDANLSDRPFGFGGGFSLSTRAGMLEIIYALGKSAGQPFGLDHSKIHIGYSSRF